MISVRGGAGLGDSLYVQAIARHLVGQGHRVEACSHWPDVFKPLGDRVTVSPFRRSGINRLAHYSTRRGITQTTQFEDCCITAGITGPVDLRLDWAIEDAGLVRRLREPGRPVVLVAMPRPPMSRADGFGDELLPSRAVLQRQIDRLRRHATLVQVGAGKPLWRWDGIGIDLANQTSVSQFLDVATGAGGLFGWPSLMIPLAESLDKPMLITWSRRGLNSRREVIRQMTPQKLLHRRDAGFAIDDYGEKELARSVDAFLEQVGSPAPV